LQYTLFRLALLLPTVSLAIFFQALWKKLLSAKKGTLFQQLQNRFIELKTLSAFVAQKRAMTCET